MGTEGTFQGPICIGGMQRSGTSLIRATVGSHPDIALFQWDIGFWVDSYPGYRPLWGNTDNMVLAKHILYSLSASGNKQAYDLLDHKPDLEKVYRRFIESGVADTKDYDLFIGKINQAFFQEYFKLRNRKIWGFKTPGNEFYAHPIDKAFPSVRFIHVIRNIHSTVSSMKKLNWLAPEDEALVEYVLQWYRSLERLLMNRERFPGRYLPINYENFVADPEFYLRLICWFIGTEFSSDMEKMQRHPQWQGSSSAFELSSKQISQHIASREISNLTGHEYQLIEQIKKGYESNLEGLYGLSAPKAIEADFLIKTGQQILRDKETFPVMELFKKAAQIDPSNDMAHLQLGRLHERQGDLPKAFDAYVEAFRINPARKKTILSFSRLLAPMGKREMIREMFMGINEKVPEEIQAMFP